LRGRVETMLPQFQQWIEEHFHISIVAQDQWWQQAMDNTGKNIGAVTKASANAIFNLFLIPVFAAPFLYNRKDFVCFLEGVAGKQFNGRLQIILSQAIHTYHNIVKGMIWVYLIVGILNTIGLLALGIRHALLFGFLTDIMTIIPYIGIFISALLPISVAWITKASLWYPLGVIAVFGFVQYLEANVIFPKVVATQLNVSTWATLVAILAGGIL
jgi:predicted PurR-regulated permease PerM